jgi:drug/metabolite transporter (DMT)-like permease
MWIILSVVTAVTFALSSSYTKTLSDRAHTYVLTWSMMTLSLPWTLLFLWHQGMPPIGERFLFAAMLSVVTNLVAVTMQVKALSISPLSLTVPFLAFTPLFMLLTSWIILGEAPDARGIAGILLIVAGAYAINLDKIRGGVLGPIKAIATEPGSRLMLIVAFIWSVSAAYDKVATVESSPAFYSSFFSLAYGLLYIPLLVIGLRKRPLTPGTAPRLFLLGLVFAVMIMAQMTAITMTLASYVIAIKRAGMVVGVLMGYYVFKERNLRFRIVGAVLMSAGVLVISLA